MKKSLLFIILVFVSSIGYAQTRELKGTIRTFNKFPVNNVKVIAKKAKTEAVTNENGEFTISVKKKDVLDIKTLTFDRYTQKVEEDQTSIKINLIYKVDEKNIDVAVDEGYIDRESLTYGLENLAAQNNPFVNFANVFDAIKFAIPGATIIMENGSKKVQVRGSRTVAGSNAALLIVDGVPIDDISFIVPSEILSIKHLSSASAALYGARGGNGVIAIITK